MKKILMEDNDKDEYFHHVELNKIKEKSKQKVEEINELITIKEWDIIGSHWESRFSEYAEDIKKESEIVEIGLEKLKVSEEILEDIKYEYLNGSRLKKKEVNYKLKKKELLYNFFDILLVFIFSLQTYYGICFFHILFLYFFLLQITLCVYFLLFLLIILCYFHSNLLLCLKSLLWFFDNKLFHS